MICRSCGQEIGDAKFCPNCGAPNTQNEGKRFCGFCGGELQPDAAYCPNCGKPIFTKEDPSPRGAEPVKKTGRSRMAAGLLGIFLGGLGIHNFYLGFNGKGAAQIALTFLSCGIGSIWGFIEGILILCGNINADAEGNPLVE